jgi:hypothetical protein
MEEQRSEKLQTGDTVAGVRRHTLCEMKLPIPAAVSSLPRVVSKQFRRSPLA